MGSDTGRSVDLARSAEWRLCSTGAATARVGEAGVAIEVVEARGGGAGGAHVRKSCG